MSAVETPSGKGATGENFPVGSFLIAPRLRPHVAAFYAFARAADDIADNPALAAEDKIARLDRFAAALDGDDDDPALMKAQRLRASLAKTGVSASHAHDLLAAFRQDATKNRYRDWAEVLAYCELSANPVGRYLLDLHGEARALWPASDALCSALQVLNHVQDIGADYARLDRVYLPLEWLAAEGLGVGVLVEKRSPAGLRRVLERTLAETDRLIGRAAGLSARLASLRLALEAAAIQRLAERLSLRLHRQDPLARRVEAPRPVLLWQALSGAARVAVRRVFAPPKAAAPAPHV